MKALEVKEYVFTTDNEKHVADRKKNILKSYKIKGQKYDQQEVKDLFVAAALNVPSEYFFVLYVCILCQMKILFTYLT